MKRRFFTPGPTPVPLEVEKAMLTPIIHHMTEEFRSIFREVRAGLAYTYQTESCEVLVFASSGTGAMESAVANLLSPGDEVAMVTGGVFGERWAAIAEAYGVTVHRVDVAWGGSVDPDDVRKCLQSHRGVKAVYTVHSETSTGALHDIRTVAQLAHEHGCVVAVDAISSLGANEIRVDDWELDVVVSCSQKGLMAPPGVSFLSVSPAAWARVEKAKLPRFYFDYQRAREAHARARTSFTPPTITMAGLVECLRMIRAEGLENLWKRHATLALATREGLAAIGIEPFAKFPSNALTALRIPEGFDDKEIANGLEERWGVKLPHTHPPVAGKLLRIGHMGYYDGLDIVTVLSALESLLVEMGYSCALGSAAGAALRVLSPTRAAARA
jgi:aspartate aminotransferase-like enzyme